MKTTKMIIPITMAFMLLFSTLVIATSENLPPEQPYPPRGPDVVEIGAINEWVAAATNDPNEGDMTKYCWSWGNCEYYEDNLYRMEGEKIFAEHIYMNEGEYDIQIKAIDLLGEEGNWSDPLTINVVGAKIYTDKETYIVGENVVCTIENILSNEIEITKIFVGTQTPRNKGNIILQPGEIHTFNVSTILMLGENTASFLYLYNGNIYDDESNFRVIPDMPPQASQPSGETECASGKEYTYNSSILCDYNDIGVYYRFIFDNDSERWRGPISGELTVFDISATHVWNEASCNHKVVVQTTYDITIGNIVDSLELDVCVDENNPPVKPVISEWENEGVIDEELTFRADTTDPEEDTIKYGWDWNGDSEADEWSDYHNSGETDEASHSWNVIGEYDVRVIAVDDKGIESEWSEKVVVNISEEDDPDPEPENDLQVSLKSGFGIKILFKNNGTEDITGLYWEAVGKSTSLFRKYNTTSNETIELIESDKTVTEKMSTGKFFWFGRVTVTVTVEEYDFEEEYNGFVIGPFFIAS